MGQMKMLGKCWGFAANLDLMWKKRKMRHKEIGKSWATMRGFMQGMPSNSLSLFFHFPECDHLISLNLHAPISELTIMHALVCAKSLGKFLINIFSKLKVSLAFVGSFVRKTKTWWSPAIQKGNWKKWKH